MITVSNLEVQYGKRVLFKDVNLKFTPGNCYGVIGANGAGKSTFLKILSGELDSTTGEVSIDPNCRMSVLKQDHFAYDEYTVLDTIIMGNKRLYDIMKEKDALYEKEDFSDEDGIKAAELEAEFAEMDGWEADSNASKLMQGLGLDESIMYSQMADLGGNEKVKVLLAQALFGDPDIILLDEPTNHLDLQAIEWLEDFLLDYEGTVIVVSHDRHFLNKVCTHTVDIDYKKVTMYVGNYDFWYEYTQMAQRQMREQNKKAEAKIKELQDFISRFSANASKSKQATSRKKLLDSIKVEDIPVSSRRFPYVDFKPDRKVGNEVLTVTGISKTIGDRKVLDNVSFTILPRQKVAFVGSDPLAKTTLFKILMEEIEPDEGTFKWGVTTSRSYLPTDNSAYFDGCEDSLIDWVRNYSNLVFEADIRSWLGRMMFSGEEATKKANVLSGGERVRCMLCKMMLSGANVLLLDEPTNHLDLESIASLNDGLIKYPETILFTSHDHQFVETVADRIIDVTPGHFFDEAITFDEYVEKTTEQNDKK